MTAINGPRDKTGAPVEPASHRSQLRNDNVLWTTGQTGRSVTAVFVLVLALVGCTSAASPSPSPAPTVTASPSADAWTAECEVARAGSEDVFDELTAMLETYIDF